MERADAQFESERGEGEGEEGESGMEISLEIIDWEEIENEIIDFNNVNPLLWIMPSSLFSSDEEEDEEEIDQERSRYQSETTVPELQNEVLVAGGRFVRMLTMDKQMKNYRFMVIFRNVQSVYDIFKSESCVQNGMPTAVNVIEWFQLAFEYSKSITEEFLVKACSPFLDAKKHKTNFGFHVRRVLMPADCVEKEMVRKKSMLLHAYNRKWVVPLPIFDRYRDAVVCYALNAYEVFFTPYNKHSPFLYAMSRDIATEEQMLEVIEKLAPERHPVYNFLMDCERKKDYDFESRLFVARAVCLMTEHVCRTQIVMRTRRHLQNPVLGMSRLERPLDCSVCMSTVPNGVKTACNHEFCKCCINTWCYAENRMHCPVCRDPFDKYFN